MTARWVSQIVRLIVGEEALLRLVSTLMDEERRSQAYADALARVQDPEVLAALDELRYAYARAMKFDLGPIILPKDKRVPKSFQISIFVQEVIFLLNNDEITLAFHIKVGTKSTEYFSFFAPAEVVDGAEFLIEAVWHSARLDEGSSDQWIPLTREELIQKIMTAAENAPKP